MKDAVEITNQRFPMRENRMKNISVDVASDPDSAHNVHLAFFSNGAQPIIQSCNLVLPV